MVGFRAGKVAAPVGIISLAVLNASTSATVRETFDAEPNPAKWVLSGSAAWDPTYQAILLTRAGQYNSAGSIFSAEKLPAERFTVAFDFWIGAGNGADGLTFA